MSRSTKDRLCADNPNLFWCSTCGKYLPKSDFNNSKSHKYGIYTLCKKCRMRKSGKNPDIPAEFCVEVKGFKKYRFNENGDCLSLRTHKKKVERSDINHRYSFFHIFDDEDVERVVSKGKLQFCIKNNLDPRTIKGVYFNAHGYIAHPQKRKRYEREDVPKMYKLCADFCNAAIRKDYHKLNMLFDNMTEYFIRYTRTRYKVGEDIANDVISLYKHSFLLDVLSFERFSSSPLGFKSYISKYFEYLKAHKELREYGYKKIN